MKEHLKNKLRVFIAENNPEILLLSREGVSFNVYVQDKIDGISDMLKALMDEGKPSSFIEKVCMDEMTKDLRPSKANYIKEVLKTEFPSQYRRYLEAGVLRYEISMMLESCIPIFQQFDFNEENKDNLKLRHSIIAQVSTQLRN